MVHLNFFDILFSKKIKGNPFFFLFLIIDELKINKEIYMVENNPAWFRTSKSRKKVQKITYL